MRAVNPHPSSRGSRGYDEHFRAEQVALLNQGQQHLLTASLRSVRRWRQNCVQRHKMNGNVAAAFLLDNVDELLLVMCRLAHPNATDDESLLTSRAIIGQGESTAAMTSRKLRSGLA